MSRASTRASRPRVGEAPAAFEPLESRLLLASLTVTNVNDSGAGSLRQAILDADVATGASTIVFNIPGPGVHTIAEPDGLPDIVKPVAIDARTQPGYAGSPLVELDGMDSAQTNGNEGFVGLFFDAGSTGSSVEGLSIDRFYNDGIYVQNQNGLTIQADDIGYDPSGATPMPGNSVGIFVEDSSNAIIGGPNAADGNLIDSSHNVTGGISGVASSGIQLVRTNQVTIQGNIIGTDPTLTANLGNAVDGVDVGYSPGTSILSNTIANSGFMAIANADTDTTTSGNVLINNGTNIASLVLTSSTPPPVAEGQTATITYTITNNGPNTATNVQFNVENLERFYESFGDPIDYIPVYGTRPLPLISVATVTPSLGTANGSSVSLGSLANGASATVTVVVNANTAGTDGLIATVSSNQFSLTPISYPGGTGTSVTITGHPDVSVVALKPAGKAEIGVPYTFQFVVTNHDTAGLAETNYEVTNLLTPSAVLDSVTPTVGRDFGIVGPEAGISYTYYDGGDLGQLAPGASATVSVTLTPTQAGPLLVQFAASPTGGGADVNPVDNLAYAGVPVLLAPSVASTILIPVTGDIQSVKIAFAGPLAARTATDLRDYRLTTTGTAKPTPIALRSAEYDAKTKDVTLTLAHPVPRTGVALKLTLSGLTGADGTKLPAGSDVVTLTR